MLYYALVFLIVAIIAGVLGFGGIAGASAGIAQVLFFLFLIFLVISLVAGSHPPNLTLPPALAGGKLVFERQGVELSSPPLSSCGLTLCCLALPDALGYACAHPPRVARQPHPGQESICT